MSFLFNGFLYLFIVIIFCSCKSVDISGTYYSCAWNCDKLILNNDSTYIYQINPEIGALRTSKGTYSVSCRRVLLHSDTIKLYVDGIAVQDESYQLTNFRISNTKLYPIIDGKKHYCYYFKVVSDSSADTKQMRLNKLRCITKNPVRRIIYRLR